MPVLVKKFYDGNIKKVKSCVVWKFGEKKNMKNVLNELENITNSFYDFWTAWFSSYFNQMQRYLHSIKI